MSEFVTVGEKEYVVVKTGRAQAEQVLKITRWLSKYGLPIFSKVQEDSSVKADNGLEFISAILDNLSVDALIDLFIALIGCSKEDAELYFDIATLIDVVVEVYNEQPAVRRLIERFFSDRSLQVEQAE